MDQSILLLLEGLSVLGCGSEVVEEGGFGLRRFCVRCSDIVKDCRGYGAVRGSQNSLKSPYKGVNYAQLVI